MARISKLDMNRYPWLVRLIFWAQKLRYGAPLEPAFYWGRVPKILYGIQVLYRCLDRSRSPLDPALRALVSNHIAHLNHCAFCSDLSASSLEKRACRWPKSWRWMTMPATRHSPPRSARPSPMPRRSPAMTRMSCPFSPQERKSQDAGGTSAFCQQQTFRMGSGVTA